MKFNNEITLDAPPEQLFAFLSDVERVAACLPGARIDGRDGDDYQGAMRVKVGPVVADYRGTLRFVELDEDDRRAVISAKADEANGQGSANATIVTSIAEVDSGSHVTLETDLQVRGRVAQFGRGAMERIAERMFEQFAHNLEREFKGEGEPASAARANGHSAEASVGAKEPPAAATQAAGPTAERSDDTLDVGHLVGGVVVSGARRWAPAFLIGLIVGFVLARRPKAHRK